MLEAVELVQWSGHPPIRRSSPEHSHTTAGGRSLDGWVWSVAVTCPPDDIATPAIPGEYKICEHACRYCVERLVEIELGTGYNADKFCCLTMTEWNGSWDRGRCNRASLTGTLSSDTSSCSLLNPPSREPGSLHGGNWTVKRLDIAQCWCSDGTNLSTASNSLTMTLSGTQSQHSLSTALTNACTETPTTTLESVHSFHQSSYMIVEKMKLVRKLTQSFFSSAAISSSPTKLKQKNMKKWS